MPRHLISDAHEWINEIPTVPIYYLAKPQPRERAWQNQRGKKTLCLEHRDSTGASAGAVQLPTQSTPCVRGVWYGGPGWRQRRPGIPWRPPRGGVLTHGKTSAAAQRRWLQVHAVPPRDAAGDHKVELDSSLTL
jgi:hypothetical protein